MTFQQYIDNPLGKKNAVFSQRDMYKNTYTAKFDALYMREAGNIRYYLYYDKPGDTYFCHVLIPSETVTGFYYDVVVKFSTTNNALRVSSELNDYDVRFFSNDPAFVYTYANVFLNNKMYAEECKAKGSRIAHKKSPDQRNPYQIPGYVKSIYFAYLFMRRKNLFNKTLYKSAGERYSKGTMLNRIRTFDQVMIQREELEAKQKKEKQKEKQLAGKASIPKQKETKSMKMVNKLVNNPPRLSKSVKVVKPKPKVMKTRSKIT